MSRPTVAVVGAGVSGLTAAHVLSRSRAVTVFEAENRLGGHAHTHEVDGEDGRPIAVDSGFIVHNERTYPHLIRLFSELGVETRPTEMSMSISCATCGLSYAGGRGVRGILAQPWRVADPRFLAMLAEVPRFHRAARALLSQNQTDPTWGEFLQSGGYSLRFVRHFAVPLVSCVWSAGGSDALDFPARHLLRFLDHHGMLSVTGSPTWRTVVGGSGVYVERLAAELADVRRGTPVGAVARHPDGVEVRTSCGIETFDQVVIATHADQASEILVDASPQEKQDLGGIRYSVNPTVLHRDSTLLPARATARASWNYRTTCGGSSLDGPRSEPPAVSYWMNRLHGLEGAGDLVVTLNGRDAIGPARVIAEMRYEHPIFTADAVRAAQRLRGAGGERLAFAGAHLGWGFHEDGCRSGVEAAAALGATW